MKKNFCGLASVKANIGHLESAAGIAGLIKVLLCLHHKILPSLLNFSRLNHRISLTDTPFYLQRETSEWLTENDKKRIAGVSSFGFGGTNAHVIVEEYGEQRPVYMGIGDVILPLSARNSERLMELAVNLRQYLEAHPDINIHDVAYTLQVGREPMEERLAIIAGDIASAIAQLAVYQTGAEGAFFRGNIHKEKAGLLLEGGAGRAFIDYALAHKEYGSIAGLWVKGAVLDWQLLYEGDCPRRISLPAYPFEKKRYWLDDKRIERQGHVAEYSEGERLRVNVLSGDSVPEHAAAVGGGIILASLSEAAEVSPVLPATADQSSSILHSNNDVSAVLDKLSHLLRDTLYLDRAVELESKFVDHGMDSITGVEYVKVINKEFGTNISATDLYDHPTLSRLSGYIVTQLSTTVKGKMLSGMSVIEEKLVAESSPAIQLSPTVLPGEVCHGYVISSVQDVSSTVLRPLALATPKAGEVQIAVKASSINFPDIMCVKGLYPTMPSYPFVPGFEVSGVVIRVGAGVEGVSIGDEVFGLTGEGLGGHCSYVNVSSASIVKKPPMLSFEEACSLPVIFITAYYALYQSQLKQQERILIQTAAGGCGLMAVQLSHLIGAVPFGTSSNTEKLLFLQEIGLEHLGNYRSGSFEHEMRQMTHGQCFGVVLNMLSGQMIQTGLNLLGSGGRYMELAVQGLKSSAKLDLSGLTDNQQIRSIDLRRLLLSAAGSFSVQDLLKIMLGFIEKELICPVVSRVYPLSEIGAAMAYVETGEHIGKVVVSHTAATYEDHYVELKHRLQAQQKKSQANNENIFSLPGLIHTESFRNPQFDKPETTGEVETSVAVIGIASRMPGAADAAEFWENLKAAKSAVREVPESRWEQESYYNANPEIKGKSYSKWMGVLDNIDQFDPLFFNISPMEAEVMDPQQRLFLEESWKAIENAGYDPRNLSDKRCGVFIGVAPGDYHNQISKNTNEFDAYRLTGNSNSILSARISYLLNLKGPCIAVDTACSSSLVAIAQACDSLLLGNSDLALAGGVNVLSTPVLHIMTSKAGMLSPDGQCYSFDNRANGFVPAEGVGVVLLKKLSHAQRDGDHIYGVIKGWGINQDGATNGITAPSKDSQVALLQGIYDKFKIDPSTISYVEAHGTGTKLGDPIEVKALQESFSACTDKINYCGLGSVKSNIGHALAAAGVSGLIKVLLSLKSQQLPASLNYEEMNEHIRLDKSPFYIVTKLEAWERISGMPLRAAVSSFGFSGTNAHLVIEEYTGVREQYLGPAPYLLVLSARNGDRLKDQVMNLYDYVVLHDELDLYDMCYTLQTGREAMEERLSLVFSNRQELLSELEHYREGRETKISTGNSRKTKRTALPVDITLEGLISSGDYRGLLLLWIAGYPVDWELLYGDTKPRRVSLPTYPFAKKSYWVGKNEQSRKSKNSFLLKFKKLNNYSGINNMGLAEKKIPGNYLINKEKKILLNKEGMDLLNHSAKAIPEIQMELIRSLAELLCISCDDINEKASFEELGVDYFMGAALISKINTDLGLKMKLSGLTEYSTIVNLSAYIYDQLADVHLKTNYDNIISKRAHPIIANSMKLQLTPLERKDNKSVNHHSVSSQLIKLSGIIEDSGLILGEEIKRTKTTNVELLRQSLKRKNSGINSI